MREPLGLLDLIWTFVTSGPEALVISIIVGVLIIGGRQIFGGVALLVADLRSPSASVRKDAAFTLIASIALIVGGIAMTLLA